MKQYVYSIRVHNGKGTCKIGLTFYPSDRFKALKVHGTDVLKLVETADMRSLEKSLHRKFASLRVPQSEMFDLSDAEINECKQIMDRYALSSYVKLRKPVSRNSGNAVGEEIDFLFEFIGTLVIAAPFFCFL
ncbi:T5orf172 domain protein [Synechococcus sp. MIT S9509]|uniref:GIY-YIG nuclease family protein n=2 Tax=Synechococcus TaxID=1129 RepID=UPI0007BC1C98|nr:GIY-YIG nuclease family protein [Synechococcus sp. MIT S9504]KZR90151.1 T5orf172 domain protein [Synechococcus sp. MIT S9509]